MSRGHRKSPSPSRVRYSTPKPDSRGPKYRVSNSAEPCFHGTRKRCVKPVLLTSRLLRLKNDTIKMSLCYLTLFLVGVAHSSQIQESKTFRCRGTTTGMTYKGDTVSKVSQGSYAARLGVEAGWKVLFVNGKPFTDGVAADQMILKKKNGCRVVFGRNWPIPPNYRALDLKGKSWKQIPGGWCCRWCALDHDLMLLVGKCFGYRDCCSLWYTTLELEEYRRFRTSEMSKDIQFLKKRVLSTFLPCPNFVNEMKRDMKATGCKLFKAVSKILDCSWRTLDVAIDSPLQSAFLRRLLEFGTVEQLRRFPFFWWTKDYEPPNNDQIFLIVNRDIVAEYTVGHMGDITFKDFLKSLNEVQIACKPLAPLSLVAAPIPKEWKIAGDEALRRVLQELQKTSVKTPIREIEMFQTGGIFYFQELEQSAD